MLDPSTGHVLRLFHAKVQRWLQPGGHADGDANLAHVALREEEEESGIEGLRVVTPAVDLDVHVCPTAKVDAPPHLHLYVVHLVLAPPGSLPRSDPDSAPVTWVRADAPPTHPPDAATHQPPEPTHP